MGLAKALFDTDILSAIMRRKQPVLSYAESYLKSHGQFSISIITKYEIQRGLLVKSASTQLKAFEILCKSLEVLPLTDAVVDRAAKIYASLYNQGAIIGDADILIGATALENGLEIATNNISHFSRISGLQLQDWNSR